MGTCSLLYLYTCMCRVVRHSRQARRGVCDSVGARLRFGQQLDRGPTSIQYSHVTFVMKVLFAKR
jgi:hypothetical protein